MNKVAALGVLAFAVAMALLIGQRLTDEAMAVIVGSVIGVAASMPMSGLVLWLALRHKTVPSSLPMYPRPEYSGRDESPRVIVVQPQAYPAPLPAGETIGGHAAVGMPWASYGRQPREFKIIGQEEWNEERDAVV